ncbi:MAG: hypothetical protein C4288_07560 [Leptolyngbya sp. ERB_1_1]
MDAPERNSAQSNFWEKGDRIVAIIAGGAFLGGTIAQVPGAIVGSILAAIYGWYTSSAQSRPVGTRQ